MHHRFWRLMAPAPSFEAHAQNAGDVKLRRAMSDVSQGVSIDIGAADPQVESVTCAGRTSRRGKLRLRMVPQAKRLRACRHRCSATASVSLSHQNTCLNTGGRLGSFVGKGRMIVSDGGAMADGLPEDAKNLARLAELLLANVPDLPLPTRLDTTWVEAGDEALDPRSVY
jgi:hypothetical protein